MPRTPLILNPPKIPSITLDKLTEKDKFSRWDGRDLFLNGYVPVPTLFLEVYAQLKPYPLSTPEAMFVLELMSFKWTKQNPFPSYKRIAERMNVSDKMVRRYAQSLQTKTYLRRMLRKNNTNEFDLSGLFEALQKVAEERLESTRIPKKKSLR